MSVVVVPCDKIVDWASFHGVFRELLGFPDFYGCNMNAWIDCMASIDMGDEAMSTVRVPRGAVLTIHLDQASSFSRRCPDIYAALVEATAYVNWRQLQARGRALLALSFKM